MTKAAPPPVTTDVVGDASSLLLGLAAVADSSTSPTRPDVAHGHITQPATVTVSSPPSATVHAAPIIMSSQTMPLLPHRFTPLASVMSTPYQPHAPPVGRTTVHHASATTKVAGLFSAATIPPTTTFPPAYLVQHHSGSGDAPLKATAIEPSMVHDSQQQVRATDGLTMTTRRASAVARDSPHDCSATTSDDSGRSQTSSKSGVHRHQNGSIPLIASVPSPALQAPSPALASVTSTRSSGGRRPSRASSSALPPTVSHHSERSERAERGGRGNGGPELSPSPVDKHRKRLQRKAELARASRRRKKSYMNDLETRVTQLMALNTFLLNFVNKHPAVVASLGDHKLPSGLTLYNGILRSSLDLKTKPAGMDGDMGSAMSEGDGEGDDSAGESDQGDELHEAAYPVVVAPTPPPPPPQPSRKRGRAVAHTADLSLLAHATAEANQQCCTVASSPVSAVAQPPSSQSTATYLMQTTSGAITGVSQQMPIFRTPSVASVFVESNGVTLGPREVSDALSMLPAVPAPVHVKAQYRGEWRRFSVPDAEFTYPRLIGVLQSMLLPNATAAAPHASVRPGVTASLPSLLLKYVDDEGDEVEIHSTPELLEAQRSQQGARDGQSPSSAAATVGGGADGTLKLIVVDAAVSSMSAAVAPSVSPVASVDATGVQSSSPCCKRKAAENSSIGGEGCGGVKTESLGDELPDCKRARINGATSNGVIVKEEPMEMVAGS